MSPKAFIEARRQAQEAHSDHHNNQTKEYTSSSGTSAVVHNDSSSLSATTTTRPIRFEIDAKPYLPLMMATDEASMKQIIFEVFDIQRSSKDDLGGLVVTPVIGGNTNKLYCISGIPSSSSSSSSQHDVVPSKVLLRIFGGEFIDRDVETSTYAALAQQKIALPYYCRFGNGRLEEWCGDTMTTLSDDDMSKPHISTAIANEMAMMHTQFQIPDHLKEYHDITAKPTIWTQLEDWFASAILITSFQNDHDTKRAKDMEIPKLQNELDWLSTTVIPKEPSSSSSYKVGFCHNDVLASNILCSNTPNNDGGDGDKNSNDIELQLLDFEYGGINYFGYDIANHFNEFAGGTDEHSFATPDYTKFPTPDFQRRFVTEYLKAISKINSSSSSNNNENSSDVPKNYVTDGSNDCDDILVVVEQEEVDELLYEIQGFILANHLVWSLWGINQASTEGCNDFDYLHYANCRLKRYYEVKEEYIIKTSSS